MKCGNCQAEFLNSLKSCPFCGTAVPPEAAEAAAADPNNRLERLNRDAHLRESDRKFDKRGQILILIAVVSAIIVVVYGIVHQANLNRPRNMETDAMAVGFSNVSVELVSFVPEYEVYYKKDKNDTVGVDYTNGYLCRGETVNGNTVWIYARKVDSRYGRMFSDNKLQRQDYPPEDPLKLTGTITRAKDVADNIPHEIDGNIYVLEVDKYPEPYDESGQ